MVHEAFRYLYFKLSKLSSSRLAHFNLSRTSPRIMALTKVRIGARGLHLANSLFSFSRSFHRFNFMNCITTRYGYYGPSGLPWSSLSIAASCLLKACSLEITSRTTPRTVEETTTSTEVIYIGQGLEASANRHQLRLGYTGQATMTEAKLHRPGDIHRG
uniref:Uncharacterized protein n=1 Tax=Solanum tuberosum TaxID=4113 RepID=M1DLG0_SOLTU